MFPLEKHFLEGNVIIFQAKQKIILNLLFPLYLVNKHALKFKVFCLTSFFPTTYGFL